MEPAQSDIPKQNPQKPEDDLPTIENILSALAKTVLESVKKAH
jgi:hypothetical protein